mmetsp:Transcript_26319/g.76743  ORF Transcript_26319/g.76743 Transcript_26319/m.76743 type:complete len:325 (-) Transcript_26319:291-1265(-)
MGSDLGHGAKSTWLRRAGLALCVVGWLAFFRVTFSLLASQPFTPPSAQASPPPAAGVARADAERGALDAIIVPGGGLTAEGRPHPWVVERLESAAKLHYLAPASHRPAIITLSGGTPHKPPPRDSQGFPITEAAAGARYLIHDLSVPADHVYEEGFSLDTIGNGYFVRTMHTDPSGWNSLAVITNQFHMARVEAVFRWVYALPDRGTAAPGAPRLAFLPVPDTGLTGNALQARRQKEAASLPGLQATAARIRTLGQLHSFIFHEHNAYASSRLNSGRGPEAASRGSANGGMVGPQAGATTRAQQEADGAGGGAGGLDRDLLESY